MRIRLSGRVDEPSTSVFETLLDTLERCDAALCELDLKALDGLDEAHQERLQILRAAAQASGRRVVIHFPWRCLTGGREGLALPPKSEPEESFQPLRVVR